VIGLTGASLAFRDELLDLFNPGVRNVPVRAAPPQSPDALLAAVQAAHPHARVTSLTLFAEPGESARVTLAPEPGQRRGETVYIDPYTGAMLPPLRGDDAFEWIESLHRWLLLPREPGRAVLGHAGAVPDGPGAHGPLPALAAPPGRLAGLARRQSGAERPLLPVEPARRGRHLGAAAYLVFATTGAYWSLRHPARHRRRLGRRKRPPARGAGRPRTGASGAVQPVVLAPAWTTFVRPGARLDAWRRARARTSGTGRSRSPGWRPTRPTSARAVA
jgi:sulfite reductase (NADPH) flavoprotein alpha-component